MWLDDMKRFTMVRNNLEEFRTLPWYGTSVGVTGSPKVHPTFSIPPNLRKHFSEGFLESA
jgi:hypothetical protein